MAQNEDFHLDKRALRKLRKDLVKVFPKNSQTNNAIKRGMADASKPLRAGLRSVLKTEAKDTGKLWKSIQIFKAKRLDKYGRPSVFVGPKVKTPKKYRSKKGDTKAQRTQNAASRKKWADEQSGFYFLFLEYGFKSWGKKKILGLGALPRVVASQGSQTLSRLEKSIFEIMKKTAKRKGIKIS